MTYVIVVVLSVIVTFLGFAIEITNGNIGHVANNRQPKAGAAVFPNIPFVPLFIVGVVWLLDRIYPNLGFWICVVLFCVYVPYWWLSLRKLNVTLQSMITKNDQGKTSSPEIGD